MTNPLFPTTASQKTAPVHCPDHIAADEGNYFVATNPTPGTTIATTTSITAEDQTKPVLYIQNNWSASDPNARSLYLKYLTMLLGQVPTSATDWQLSIRGDNNPSGYTSGGSSITPVNQSLGDSTGTQALVKFGAVVAVTGNASSRLIHRQQINSAVPVTKDQWTFLFLGAVPSSDQIAGGSGAKNVMFACPPIVIRPGWNVRLQMWGTSNAAAPAWEFSLGYVERVQGL